MLQGGVFSSTGKIQVLGPIPKGWRATKVLLTQAVTDGSASAIGQITLGFMRYKPKASLDIEHDSDQLILPVAQTTLNYSAVAGCTSPGPIVRHEWPVRQPINECNLFLAAECTIASNHSGMITFEMERIPRGEE